MIVNAKPSGILSLGRTGENQARSIRFDISHWVMDFSPGVVELVHQRSGDPYPYPVVVSQDGNEVTWNITSTDTAMVGLGRCELRYYVGETLAKSETWMTKVFPAMGDASETPPEPQQGWVDQVLQAGAAAVEAADRAENAAVRQPYPNVETGTWWVWDAESGAYTDTGVSYGTGGGGGTSDHDKLLGRDKENQHPMSAITGLEDALASKQPTGSYITEETDPTVPAWSKAATKPVYTAAEVGADPSGTAASQVSAHNTEATAHSDMRLLIQGLTDRLNALADSDDTTLDQLSEIVAYIKSNRDLIAAITTDKVGVTDIVNDLVTNVANKPLSAAQGVALKALIDTLTAADIGAIPVPVTATVGQTIRVYAVDGNGKPTEWEAVDMMSGGGSNDIVDTLMDITVEEETASLTVTLETARAYKEIYVTVAFAGTENNTAVYSCMLLVNAANTSATNSNDALIWLPNIENSTTTISIQYMVGFSRLLPDGSFYYAYSSKASNARTQNSSFSQFIPGITSKTVVSTIEFKSLNQWMKFGVGTVVKVYGVRA